jgi:hypothetical protein
MRGSAAGLFMGSALCAQKLNLGTGTLPPTRSEVPLGGIDDPLGVSQQIELPDLTQVSRPAHPPEHTGGPRRQRTPNTSWFSGGRTCAEGLPRSVEDQGEQGHARQNQGYPSTCLAMIRSCSSNPSVKLL